MRPTSKISAPEAGTRSLTNKGHIHTQAQVQMKVKELCQAYAQAKEGSSHYGAEPHTGLYFKDLDNILGVWGSPFTHPGCGLRAQDARRHPDGGQK